MLLGVNETINLRNLEQTLVPTCKCYEYDSTSNNGSGTIQNNNSDRKSRSSNGSDGSSGGNSSNRINDITGAELEELL